MNEVPRMHCPTPQTNPLEGRVAWSPSKSLWFWSNALIAVIGSYLTFSLDAAVVAAFLTVITLCLGQSVGLHRLLIHRSFECPWPLELALVYLGSLVGLGGPRRVIYLHEIRDWSQRHPRCHPLFIHASHPLRDFWWQLNCEVKLDHPPVLILKPGLDDHAIYRAMDRFWPLLQLPVATILLAIGGVPWVIWGICVRITVSMIGHWLVGYLAHNVGQRDWHLEGHAVQGYNVPGFGLLTMGEAWHNNHHAFPKSARFGLNRGQLDPGWWALCLLAKWGLAKNFSLPENLPERAELHPAEELPPAQITSRI